MCTIVGWNPQSARIVVDQDYFGRSRMQQAKQVAEGQTWVKAVPLCSCIWLYVASCFTTCAQNGLDSLQLCAGDSFPSTNKCKYFSCTQRGLKYIWPLGWPYGLYFRLVIASGVLWSQAIYVYVFCEFVYENRAIQFNCFMHRSLGRIGHPRCLIM